MKCAINGVRSVIRILSTLLSLSLLYSSSALPANAPHSSEATKALLIPKWDEAVKSLSTEAPEKSVQKLASWIELAEANKIQSPEAHYNYAAQLWKNKDGAEAVRHILAAAQLRSSPIHGWNDLNLLSEMQFSLGIQEPLSDRMGWRLSTLFPTSRIKPLFCIPVWCLLLALFLRFGLVPPKRLAGSAWTVAVAITILLTALSMNYTYRMECAVVAGDEDSGTVPLYKDAKIEAEQKLVELPAGTLVSIAEKKDGFSRIETPMAGWIQAVHLQPAMIAAYSSPQVDVRSKIP